ncbi:MAG: hypothetical protein R3F49_01140 [Planctomycetota bacterium]
MSTLARMVLYLGCGLVLATWFAVRRDLASLSSPQRMTRGEGFVEGRVALDGAWAALLARKDVPPLEVRATLPFGDATTGLEQSGRFLLTGLPMQPVDLEVRLGGEVLATLPCVTPKRDAGVGALDTMLDGIALDGPPHVIELEVLGLDGRGVEAGWLAWRHAGDAVFESVVPIRDGAATVVSLAPLVDVAPLIPGCAAAVSPCVFHRDRIFLAPGRRLVAEAPQLPTGVLLRLEVVRVDDVPELAGDAQARGREFRGGWVADRRAELLLPASGAVTVRWGAYLAHAERLTRLRRLESETVTCDAAAFGVTPIRLPIDAARLEALRAQLCAEEGLLQR